MLRPLVALAAIGAAGCASFHRATPVTVCVLEDTVSPPRTRVDVRTVLDDYARNTGVRFEITDYRPWPFEVERSTRRTLEAIGDYLASHEGAYAPMILERDASGPAEASNVDFLRVAVALRAACDADVRVVLTDKQFLFAYIDDGRLMAKRNTGNFVHEANAAIVYGIDTYALQRDACGNPLPETVLRHELGHKWYGDGHDPDTRSFMHGPAKESCGMWTPDLRKRIRASLRR